MPRRPSVVIRYIPLLDPEARDAAEHRVEAAIRVALGPGVGVVFDRADADGWPLTRVSLRGGPWADTPGRVMSLVAGALLDSAV